MMTRRDISVFSIAAGSAALLGLGLGAWSALPSYMAEPSRAYEPAMIAQIDPNLARYRQMLEMEGVDPIPHVVVAGFYPAPEPALASTEELAAGYTPVDDVADLANPAADSSIPAAAPAPRTYALAYRTSDPMAAPIAAVQPVAAPYAAPQIYAAPQPSQGGAEAGVAPALPPSAPPQGG